MKRSLLFIPCAALFLITIFFAGCSGKVNVLESTAQASEPTTTKPAIEAKADTTAPAPPASDRRWEAVKRETLYQIIPTLGTFQARQTSKLGSQVNGRVETVKVDIGDVVKKGQELVRIDPKFYELEVAQRKTELESAKVAVADAKLKLDRTLSLWGDGKSPPISRQELDQAQTTYDLAVSKAKQSEEGVKYSEERLRETIIRAPYDGVITQRFMDSGELIAGMMVSHLLEIQETDPIELLLSLAQENASRVKKGMKVLFRVEGIEAGQGLGIIEMVFPQMDAATRSIRCRVLVANPDFKYRPGLLAEVGVVEREIPNALSIPRAALMQSGDAWRVVVRENGQSVEREVKIGVTFLEKAEVLEGLKEGDEIGYIERQS